MPPRAGPPELPLKIAFISDIHSAAAPYEAALEAARQEGFDQLVIMGDLLTYGPEPERCLDLTREVVERDRAVLILGNHDAMYRQQGYDRPLPEWIRESMEWTRGRLPVDPLEDFHWQERWSSGPLLVSHANPFGSGDWSYLRSDEDYERAAQALAGQGFGYGVFGHVHRFAEYQGQAASVFTIGSVGQPRNRDDPRPHWAMGELTGENLTLSPRPLDFDWRDHCRALRSTNMSEATIEQLCRFYP